MHLKTRAVSFGLVPIFTPGLHSCGIGGTRRVAGSINGYRRLMVDGRRYQASRTRMALRHRVMAHCRN